MAGCVRTNQRTRNSRFAGDRQTRSLGRLGTRVVSRLAFWHCLQRGAKALHCSSLRIRLSGGENPATLPTLQALPLVLGQSRALDTPYLDACRIKRNTVEYDYAGAATLNDSRELTSSQSSSETMSCSGS